MLSAEDKEKEWTFRDLQYLIAEKETDFVLELFNYNPELMALCDSTNENTLLTVAAAFSEQICQYLMEKGGQKPSDNNKFKMNAYHQVAAQHAYYSDVTVPNNVLKMFITKFPNDEGVNQQDRNKMTPLHIACSNDGNIEMVKMLLAHSMIDVNLKDRSDKLPGEGIKSNEIKDMIIKFREKK